MKKSQHAITRERNILIQSLKNQVSFANQRVNEWMMRAQVAEAQVKVLQSQVSSVSIIIEGAHLVTQAAAQCSASATALVDKAVKLS